MRTPSFPADEALRRETIAELDLLGADLEDRFERVTRLVSMVLQTPIAAFSIVEGDRQCFRAIQGLDAVGTARDVSFCGHTILQQGVFVVTDARRHPWFRDNPLVTGDPNIGFYAGAPVRAPNQRVVGSLCAIDTHPRELTPTHRRALTDLRDILEEELALRAGAVRAPTTGLYTRSFFEDVARRELERLQGRKLSVALLLVRVDDFDGFVDLQGHRAGDALLRAVADCLRSTFQAPGQLIANYRASDFAVLLPDFDRRTTTEHARTLRERVSALAQAHPSTASGQAAVSIGAAVADAEPKRKLGLSGLVTVAYEALANTRDLGSGGVSIL